MNVSGHVPEWLDVRMYKNGFGKFESDKFEFKFLFDVMAYVVRWEVKDGRVTLTNRVIHSEYNNDSKVEIPPYRTFGGTKPPMPWKEAVKMILLHPDKYVRSDNLNVNIVNAGGKLVTISDQVGVFELDPETLKVRSRFEFNDTLAG